MTGGRAGTAVTDADFVAVTRFLYDEAQMLDENRLDDWLGCLAGDLRYFMPVRTSLLRADIRSSASDTIGHFDDDYEAIAFRVKRLQVPTSWSEDPPSRTRRFVTNIRVEHGNVPDEFDVVSYLLVMRNRWDDPQYEIITAERQDVLRRVGDDLRLARRRIIGDQVTMGTINLTIFL